MVLFYSSDSADSDLKESADLIDPKHHTQSNWLLRPR